MQKGPDKRVPHLQVGPRSLPSLGQRASNRAGDGDQTRAFRAALRGLSPQEALKMASRDTMPLPSERLTVHIAATARHKRGHLASRRLPAIVASLLLLLGIGVPVLGAHMGVLAFSLGATQTAVPLRSQAEASNSGMMQIDLPADTTTKTSLSSNPVPVPPTPTPIPPTATPRPQPTNPPAPSGPYSSWTPPPGYNSFAVSDFPGDPWAGSFGQCTWWAAHKRPDENFLGWGDAWNWANAARARGYTVTATPTANATVVFAPGVEGASSLGHVSHVEQVLTNGWVLVSEMNFFFNGGGFARVDYRYVYAGSGVWFIP